MRKFLSLAFLLLTLLCGTEVQAQTYYTENGQIYGDYDNSDYYSDNVRCSWCGVLMTQEEYAYHDCDERTSVNDDDDIFSWGGVSSGSVHVYDDGDAYYGGGGSTSGNVGSYHPDNNATSTEITPPYENLDLHVPLDNEVLFKNNLPANTLMMTCHMTCVPTAVSSIIGLMESDKSAIDVRARLEADYIMLQDETYSLCRDGIKVTDMDNFMTRAGFYSTCANQLVDNINDGYPCAAVIDIGKNGKEELHMIEIVGYFIEPVKDHIVFTSEGPQIVKTQEPVNAYQCINPGTGKYETHYDYEFKYPNMIYCYYKYIR